MRFDIILAPEAVEDFKALKANVRSTVRAALEKHLRHAAERHEPQQHQAACAVLRAQNTGFVSMKSAFSTMCPARPSTFWRSWPNRRLSYGWHNSEVRSEAGAIVRSEGRPFAFP